MKKTAIALFSILLLTYVACNNQEKHEEEAASIETAVEQMTQALDTTNAVEAVTDSTATSH